MPLSGLPEGGIPFSEKEVSLAGQRFTEKIIFPDVIDFW